MSRDSSYTYLHLSSSKYADFLDEFSRPGLSAPELAIAPEHQPPNPEDEDNIVPDQHAAFGIQRATQARREPEWRDLGVAELLEREGRTIGSGSALVTGSGAGAGGSAAAANGPASRISEGTRAMIRVSLGRRELARGSAGGAGNVRGANGGVGR